MTDHGHMSRLLTRLLVVPVLLLAAACGGADDGDDSATAAGATDAPGAQAAASTSDPSGDQAVAASTAAADGSYDEYGYEASGNDGPATPAAGGSVASLNDILALSSRFEQTATWGAEVGGVRFLSPNGLTIDAAGIRVRHGVPRRTPA